MWARCLEQLLGAWLAISALVLERQPDGPGAFHDLSFGLLIVVLSGLTWLHRLRRLHLVLLPVSAWLIGWGWLHVPPGAMQFGPAQNEIVIGLTLAMLAIVPSHASDPPEGWDGADPAS